MIICIYICDASCIALVLSVLFCLLRSWRVSQSFVWCSRPWISGYVISDHFWNPFGDLVFWEHPVVYHAVVYDDFFFVHEFCICVWLQITSYMWKFAIAVFLHDVLLSSLRMCFVYASGCGDLLSENSWWLLFHVTSYFQNCESCVTHTTRYFTF